MDYSWREKVAMWWCKKFSHKIDPSKDRWFNGFLHNDCKRCGHSTFNGKCFGDNQ